MKEKFEAYEESGVREYWLIHAVDRNVIVYVLHDNTKCYGEKPYIESDMLTSVIFPDLKINLPDIFENA